MAHDRGERDRAVARLRGDRRDRDGIFIGATRTRDMRNASLASTGAFVLAAWLLAGQAGNRGLWYAFILFAIARALALAARYPALRRSIEAGASR